MKSTDCTIKVCLHKCPYCGRPVPEHHAPCGYCAIAEQLPVEALKKIIKAKAGLLAVALAFMLLMACAGQINTSHEPITACDDLMLDHGCKPALTR
ncbi:MAG: hypothetical protein M0036_20725 [Desulfobacteraceae bacterium]|nr:hypothetical protein [Desulfobacteraceae bacterium]